MKIMCTVWDIYMYVIGDDYETSKFRHSLKYGGEFWLEIQLWAWAYMITL